MWRIQWPFQSLCIGKDRRKANHTICNSHSQAVTVISECTHGYLWQTVWFQVLSSLNAISHKSGCNCRLWVHTWLPIPNSLFSSSVVFDCTCCMYIVHHNKVVFPFREHNCLFYSLYNIWKTQLFLQQIRLGMTFHLDDHNTNDEC